MSGSVYQRTILTVYSTVQYSIVQYSTVQYIKYSTVPGIVNIYKASLNSFPLINIWVL